MWACELSVLGIGPMPSPLFFSYLNEMTDNSPMLFEKKMKVILDLLTLILAYLVHR